MKNIFFLLCLIGLAACSTLKPVKNDSDPELLFQHPLPPVPESITRPSFDLEMVLFILADGTVEKARLLKGSGDEEWDKLAVASIKQWRFKPARMNEQPINTWYHLRSMVRFANPKIMVLSEILCTTKQEADTIYQALTLGANFGDLAMKYSVSPSREMNGMIGDVNVNMYPENIRETLYDLRENDYTSPIKYGDLYVIFKRIKKP